MIRQITLVVTFAVFATWPQAAPAQAAAETASLQAAFEQQFGADLEAVRGTGMKEDDAKLAMKILAAVAEQGPPQDLAAYLCHQAYDLAMSHPTGYPYAMLAMHYVDKLDEAVDTEARRKLIRTYVAFYEHGKRTRAPGAPDAEAVLAQYTQLADDQLAAGDGEGALQTLREGAAFAGRAGAGDQRAVLVKRMSEIDAIIARNQRIEELQAILAKQPNDRQAVAALFDIHLVEMDAPGKAVELANALEDKAARDNVRLAAADPKQLNSSDSFQLAQWYELKGRDPGNANRIAMLIRAKLYYEQFQTRYQDRDGKWERAAAALKDIEDQLHKLGVGKKLARRKVIKLRGEAPKGGANPQIDRAIAKGVEWLYAQQDQAVNWEVSPDGQPVNHPGGRTALVAYALLMAEENPITNDKLSRAVRATFSRPIDNTYGVCFRAHMWEALPDGDVFDQAMRHDADRLTNVITDRGEYHYKIQRGTTGDLSTTLAGFLTLWLAETSGVVEVRHESWRMICNRLISIQRADGGWAYKNTNERPTTGSMTAAGLTILLMALDRDHLTDPEAQAAREAIDRAMNWLDRHFAPNQNPGQGNTWKNYYLVAVQHVGVMSGRRLFNNLDWYETAAKHLVATQGPDGSWANGDLDETAFAVIFLARGGIYYSPESGADADPPHPAGAHPAGGAAPHPPGDN